MAFSIMNTTLLWTAILSLIFSGFTMTASIPSTNHTGLNTTTTNNHETIIHAPNKPKDKNKHKNKPKPKRWGGTQYCGASTFANRISDASPWISDCTVLLDDFIFREKIHFDWGYGGNCEQRAVDKHLSCHIGIQTDDPSVKCGLDDYFKFGNGDGIYVINESIVRFGDQNIGKVGTEGIMDCRGTDDDGFETGRIVTIKWGLY